MKSSLPSLHPSSFRLHPYSSVLHPLTRRVNRRLAARVRLAYRLPTDVSGEKSDPIHYRGDERAMRKLLAAILFSLALVACAFVQAPAQDKVVDKTKDAGAAVADKTTDAAKATAKGTKTAAKKTKKTSSKVADKTVDTSKSVGGAVADT